MGRQRKKGRGFFRRLWRGLKKAVWRLGQVFDIVLAAFFSTMVFLTIKTGRALFAWSLIAFVVIGLFGVLCWYYDWFSMRDLMWGNKVGGERVFFKP